MSLLLLKVVPFLKLVLIIVSFTDFSFSLNEFLFFIFFIWSAISFQITGPLNLKLFLPISFFGLIIWKFKAQEHETKTRNNQYLLTLARIKTEYARKSFWFMGAKIYNELSINIRKTESSSTYDKLLKKHFS